MQKSQWGAFRVKSGGSTFILESISTPGIHVGYGFNEGTSAFVTIFSQGVTSGKINSISIKAVDAHSLVTATADNATVTRQLTRASANRNTRWKIKAPDTNVGDVKVSQDNGSTSITLTPGEFADIELGEQTSANPTIWLQLTDDGDTVEHYDVQMAELAAGTPVPNFVPQGATPAAVGASLFRHTASDLDAFDMSFLFVVPNSAGTQYPRILSLSDDTLSNTLEVFGASGDWYLRNTVAGTQEDDIISALTEGDTVLLRTQWDAASVLRVAVDDESWVNGTPKAIPDFTIIDIGSHFGGSYLPSGIIALRDNNGQLLGTPGAGFNISAIERYEASL